MRQKNPHKQLPGERQTLLLTGAKGFTGRHLEAAATAVGYRVHSLLADITDDKALNTEIAWAKPDVVIHLAAISSVTHPDPFELYRVNVFGTQNVLQALTNLSRRPTATLIASSGNIYGNCEVSSISELEVPAPVNHYSLSKFAAEGVARMFADKLSLTVVRPFNYTGVGHDQRFVIPKIVHAYSGCSPVLTLGNLLVEREYNDVRFVVDTYLQLLKAKKNGEIYNLCSGLTYSLATVLEVMDELSVYKPKIEIDQSLVRTNELMRLCGSPHKLASINASKVENNLRSLLKWMLVSDNGIINK
jgi:GDP-6-deoxy-D-talose 4-dehydrogenase